MSLRSKIQRYLRSEGYRPRTLREWEEEISRALEMTPPEFAFRLDCFTQGQLDPDEAEAFCRLIAPHWPLIVTCDNDETKEEALYDFVIKEFRAQQTRCDRAALRVVDAGCGVGLLTVFLAKTFPACSFRAYDQSPAFIEVAQARADRYRVTNIDFETAEHGAFRPGSDTDLLLLIRNSELGAPCCPTNARLCDGYGRLVARRILRDFGYLPSGGLLIIAQELTVYAVQYLTALHRDLTDHVYLSHHLFGQSGRSQPCHQNDPIRPGAIAFLKS